MSSVISAVTSSSPAAGMQEVDVTIAALSASGSCFEAQVVTFAANPFVSVASGDAAAAVTVSTERFLSALKVHCSNERRHLM